MPHRGKKTIITLSVDTPLLKRVDGLAKAQGCSRSWLIEQWMREKMEGDEVAVKALANPVVMEAMLKMFGDMSVLKAVAGAVVDDVSTKDMRAFQQVVKSMDGALPTDDKPKKRGKKA